MTRTHARPPRENNPAELRAFETTCERLGGFNEQIDFEWVDGFLTALAAGLRVPEPEEWLPALCGDAFERSFADPEDATQALRSLQVRLKVLCDQMDAGELMEDPGVLRLAPLMTEWGPEDRARLVSEGLGTVEEAATFNTGALWAAGFVSGMEAFPAQWPEPVDDEEAAVCFELQKQIDLLLLPPASDLYLEHVARYYPQGEPTRDELIAEACYAAQELHLVCVDHAPKPETRRVQPVPGRNDPCPCGSGKKYKKCHGGVAG